MELQASRKKSFQGFSLSAFSKNKFDVESKDTFWRFIDLNKASIITEVNVSYYSQDFYV